MSRRRYHYYHKHSDGTVSWLDDDEEDERDLSLGHRPGKEGKPVMICQVMSAL